MILFLTYSMRNLWARRVTTVLTLSGMSLAVFIFTAVLMLVQGLETTLVKTGQPDNAIVLRKGASSEIGSTIYRDQVDILKALPHVSKNEKGIPLLAPEMTVLVHLRKRGSETPGNVLLRGGARESVLLRPQIRLVAGRMWRSGARDVITGVQVARRFEGAGLGEQLRFGKHDWTVVGVFEAGGSGFESEIWGEAHQFMTTVKRTSFSSATLRLSTPQALRDLEAHIDRDPRLQLQVQSEAGYYANRSERLAGMIRGLGLIASGLFSIGAMLGAMITMYGAVATRAPEIGTLRALGFSRRRIAAAFLAEALTLGTIGGSAGIAGASFLQLKTLSMINWGTFSELAFGFTLSPRVLVTSLLFSLAMALLGGLLPALQAASMNVADALKQRPA